MNTSIKTIFHNGYRIDIIDYGCDGLAHNITNLNLAGCSIGPPDCQEYTTEEGKQKLIEKLIQEAKDEIDAKLLR